MVLVNLGHLNRLFSKVEDHHAPYPCLCERECFEKEMKMCPINDCDVGLSSMEDKVHVLDLRKTRTWLGNYEGNKMN